MLDLRHAVERLLDLLSPRRCISCDGAVVNHGAFCSRCQAELRPDSSPVVLAGGPPVVALGRYQDPLASAIRRFKYADRPDLARPLGNCLSGVTARHAHETTFVPVPLHPARLRMRGYNQAALLARVLAQQLGQRVQCRALERARHGPPQAECTREQRFDNARDAYKARHRLDGVRVVLVDDVVTTGATLTACTHALTRAGAEVVVAVCLARAELEPDSQPRRSSSSRAR